MKETSYAFVHRTFPERLFFDCKALIKQNALDRINQSFFCLLVSIHQNYYVFANTHIRAR